MGCQRRQVQACRRLRCGHLGAAGSANGYVLWLSAAYAPTSVVLLRSDDAPCVVSLRSWMPRPPHRVCASSCKCVFAPVHLCNVAATKG